MSDGEEPQLVAKKRSRATARQARVSGEEDAATIITRPGRGGIHDAAAPKVLAGDEAVEASERLSSEAKRLEAKRPEAGEQKKRYQLPPGLDPLALQGSARASESRFTLNPDNVKPTCRFDYAKDLCKDYNETGWCVFGDTCIFLHDRGDYKSGWQLDQEWDLRQRSTSAGAVEEKGEPPEATTGCRVCGRDEPTRPVQAECGHRFCEECALQSYNAIPSCPTCKKKWIGSFKTVKQ